MDVRRLRSFVRIAELGSISRAAVAIGVAQPALSQQLATLEEELRVKLVERSSSGVRLTEAGQMLYGRAQAILRQVDDLTDDLRSPANRLTGPIAVGVPPSLSESLTLPLLETLCRDHSQLRPQVVEEGAPVLEELLISGGLAAAVLAKRPDREAVVAERLLAEPLMLVAPAAWKLTPDVGLEALSKLPWVTTRRAHSVRALVESVFAQAGLECRVVAEIDSLPTVVRAVQRGVGATVLPLGAARHAAQTGEATVMPFGDPPLLRPMFLCWRRAAVLDPRTELLLDLLRGLTATFDRSGP